MLDPEPSKDRVLIDRVLARDPRAAEQLGDRLRCVPRFLAARNRRMGRILGEEDLRDATQETVAIVWQKLDEFRGDAAFETWCYAIAGGVFMNAIRASQRQRPAASVGVGEGEFEPSALDPEVADYSHVHRCLGKLAQEDEFLVRARAFDAWSFDTIATHTQRSVAALKARYYRALRKLQVCLAPFLRREQ